MQKCNVSPEKLSNLINDVTVCCRYDECEECPIYKHIKNDEYCDSQAVLRWLKTEVFINGSDGS